MSLPRMAAAVSYISDDMILTAEKWMPEKPRMKTYRAIGIAAAACLVLLVGVAAANYGFSQYVAANAISAVAAQNDSYDVSTAQAEMIERANSAHNKLAEQGFSWYGNCYYDLKTDVVMLGLTENTERNRAAALSIIGDMDVQFYECEHSYSSLVELYDSIDSRWLALRMLGVERYNIDIADNVVNVYLSNGGDNAAMYFVSKLDESGAVVFKTYNPELSTDDKW